MTVLIRIDSVKRQPTAVCFCAYDERDRRRKKLKPESRSRHKYMQSISNVGLQMLNAFKAYPAPQVVFFSEWCTKFMKFADEPCKLDESKRLYYNQRFGMVACDYSSQDLTDDKLTHKV